MADIDRGSEADNEEGRPTSVAAGFPVSGRGRWSGLLLLRLGSTFEREMEAGRGFLWLPVLFGAGILVYFALPAEPSLFALGAAAAFAWIAARRLRQRIAAFRLAVALAMLVTGAATIKLRTEMVSAPVLDRERTAEITGWVAAREAVARGGARLRLQVHSIEDLPAPSTPSAVRITVRSRSEAAAVGDALTVLARLRPPSGPVMPGGYDFARADFYDGIGAVGFAYGAARPAEIGPPPAAVALAKPVADLRETIRWRVLAALPGDRGNIAAALIMGDQRGISEAIHEAMRASGLGHILSISGLHMVLVAGSAFWLIRALLALSPSLALRRPIKKWAAAGGLVVAVVYLFISGAAVATQRAFVMMAVMLLAVLADRRAISLRNVAIAALIVLIIEPESLLTASFQMSFAATVALVAGYEAIRDRLGGSSRLAAPQAPWPAAQLWLSARGLVITSVLAALATTPFAIYHFQRAAPLALLANLAAMPVVGLIVMPAALFSVIAMPFGLEAVPLTVMGWGIEWVVEVAAVIAAWSEGWGLLRAPPASALLLAVAGFLWLALWRERWRLAGFILMLAALPLALLDPRPDILVDASGRTVAVRDAAGRYAVIGTREARFAVAYWLRADGDARTVDDDLSAETACDALGCTATLADGSKVAVALSQAAFADDCRLARVVVSGRRAPAYCGGSALVIDRSVLDAGGAHALYLDAGVGSFRIESAHRAGVVRPFLPRRDQ
jgi:competence protein ComEC